jgi:hypothetical protein
MIVATMTMVVMIILAVGGMGMIMVRAIDILVMAEGFQQRCAEQPGDDRANKRKENDCVIHSVVSPSSC